MDSTTIKKDSRNTKQKNLILDFLKQNSDKHLPADEIFNQLSQKDAKIGVATVYRNLKRLEDLGVIEKLYGINGNAPSYKVLRHSCEHSHHHLICKKCNAIIDFEDDLLESIEKIIQLTKDFTITDHKVVFYGVCSKCKI